MTDEMPSIDLPEDPLTASAKRLRQRAEETARRKRTPLAESPDSLSFEAARQLLHELQVHQIELEMQNEELRRTQAELEASRARYFDLYDLAPVGYFTLSEQGLILEANLTAADLLGMTRSALVKQPLSRFILPEDQDIYYRHRKPLVETGTRQVFDLRLVKQEAAPFWARLEAVAARDADGVPVFRAVVSDVSERKRVEEALRETGRLKDQFLAMLAHELRNPLAPILNAVQVLKEIDHADPTMDWGYDVIDRQVHHISRLLDDLLDVARITQNKITLKKERLNLAAVLEEVAGSRRSLFEARRQTFTLTLPAAPQWLIADPVRLEQIITNLLTNAAKYTPEVGEIRLSAKREANQALIRVTDTGIGISPMLLPHVFDLFIQGDLSLAHSQGGLGLGLYVVRRLVELHGGTVSALSKGIGQGSEFTLSLPLLSDECPGADSTITPAQAEVQSAPSGLRILVVDDFADAAKSLALLLGLKGHEVDTADCGMEALARAQVSRPQVVVLDIGLPDLDGYEVARRLRELPETCRSLLIAVSGMAEDRERSRATGFDHFLLKPLDPNALLTLMAVSSAG